MLKLKTARLVTQGPGLARAGKDLANLVKDAGRASYLSKAGFQWTGGSLNAAKQPKKSCKSLDFISLVL